MEAMELGLRQIQEEMGCGREENTTTRDVVQSVEKTFKKRFANINQKLDDLLDLISIKF